ncbi:MAG: hypothetical protein QOJ16_256 [Acidobacteriota bacterium]|jgi:hypothetical protein|nr:hypothetical protein [Acidobacteriota bacterium]
MSRNLIRSLCLAVVFSLGSLSVWAEDIHTPGAVPGVCVAPSTSPGAAAPVNPLDFGPIQGAIPMDQACCDRASLNCQNRCDTLNSTVKFFTCNPNPPGGGLCSVTCQCNPPRI